MVLGHMAKIPFPVLCKCCNLLIKRGSGVCVCVCVLEKKDMLPDQGFQSTIDLILWSITCIGRTSSYFRESITVTLAQTNVKLETWPWRMRKSIQKEYTYLRPDPASSHEAEFYLHSIHPIQILNKVKVILISNIDLRLYPESKISQEKVREVIMSRVPWVTLAKPGIKKWK